MPRIVEDLFFAHGIHALPVTFMAVGHQLTVGSQIDEGVLFEHHLVVGDIFHHFGLEHEERTIDPAFADLRLFGKAADPVAREFKMAIAGRGANRRQCRQLTVRTVEIEQGGNIDIGHPVAPRYQRRFIAEIGGQLADATAGASVLPSFDQIDRPVGNGWQCVAGDGAGTC